LEKRLISKRVIKQGDLVGERNRREDSARIVHTSLVFPRALKGTRESKRYDALFYVDRP
jgi:hypothetical protein